MVYVIEHIRSFSYYIGVHSSKHNDILSGYTTSSKFINKIIDKEGLSSFRVINIMYFSNRRRAELVENILIRKNYNDHCNLNISASVTIKKKLTENYYGVNHHFCNINSNVKLNKTTFRLFEYSETVNSEFYSSKEWLNVRCTVLDKNNYTCVHCTNKAGDGVQLFVKHIIDRIVAPELSLDVDNLHIVCERCLERHLN